MQKQKTGGLLSPDSSSPAPTESLETQFTSHFRAGMQYFVQFLFSKASPLLILINWRGVRFTYYFRLQEKKKVEIENYLRVTWLGKEKKIFCNKLN